MQAVDMKQGIDKCWPNKATAKHGVPPSTLKDQLSGYVKHETKPGPAAYLNQQEEKELTEH